MNLMSRLQHAMFRTSTRLEVPEFDGRMFLAGNNERGRAAVKLRDALALIHIHSPTRYRHLRRDLPRVLIGLTHNRGECHYQIGLCLLNAEYLADEHTTPEEVAAVLVHEGMHARLARAGFTYDAKSRARHEHLCLLAEALVSRRFVDQSEYERASRGLRAWSPDEWTDEADLQRRLAALRARGVQGRFGRMVEHLLIWRARRFQKRAV